MSDQKTSDTAVLDRPPSKEQITESDEKKGFEDFSDNIVDESLNIYDFLNSQDYFEENIKEEKEDTPKSITIKKTELKAEIELFDEPFFLMKKGNEIHFKHKVWSLSGFGKSSSEAFEKLKENGKILLSAYSDIDKSDLSDDAKEMIDFLNLTFRDG